MLRLNHIIMTICVVLMCCIGSYAQQDRERFKAIESEKVAYITKELRLTPTEAQKFFPIYNKYNEEMWELKKAKRGTTTPTPRGVQSFNGGQRDVIAFDAKEVDIKKKYRTQFTQVVGSARASQFFQVVEDFNDLLRNELENRRNKDQGR